MFTEGKNRGRCLVEVKRGLGIKRKGGKESNEIGGDQNEIGEEWVGDKLVICQVWGEGAMGHFVPCQVIDV